MPGPYVRPHGHRTPGMATAGTPTEEVAVPGSPLDGLLASATFTSDATMTGANTNYRSLQVYNRTKAAVMATIDMVSGVNATAFTPLTITNGSEALRAVSAGDVITFRTTVAGTGLALPAGAVRINLQA